MPIAHQSQGCRNRAELGGRLTIYDVLRACGRRWYAVALGLAITSLVVVALLSQPGVYWARSQILFLGPPVPTRPNKLDSNSGGLIATAGIIEREMNAHRTRIPATSADVTLLDQGVYDGELVRLPNSGGQWATNFADPTLDIEASGDSPDSVRTRIEAMTEEAATILARRQDESWCRDTQ